MTIKNNISHYKDIGLSLTENLVAAEALNSDRYSIILAEIVYPLRQNHNKK